MKVNQLKAESGQNLRRCYTVRSRAMTNPNSLFDSRQRQVMFHAAHDVLKRMRSRSEEVPSIKEASENSADFEITV